MFNIKRFCTCMLLSAILAFVGCSKDDDTHSRGFNPDLITEAHITDTTYYADKSLTAYNFVYPSKDPYGNDVMLSGTITFGDAVKDSAYAKGLLLYNHYTVYRADQCPSKGYLSDQKYFSLLSLITISPDYYGFGATESKNQGYCISQANAQAAVDALLAAKKILAAKGFSWGDRLFNLGYSQGGQTTMGVIRLVAEKNLDINFTYTFAGAGVYDLPQTYRQFLSASFAGKPSTVVSVMLAYNQYKNLGIAREAMLTEPVLSLIDEWILSKNYTLEEIDQMIGPLTIDQYSTPTMRDTASSLSLSMMEALDLDNLCKGWSPRGNEKILLFHSSLDDYVPVVNTHNLYNFLIDKGLPPDNVDLDIQVIGPAGDTPAHKNAGTTFGLTALAKMIELLKDDE
jgi:hypothetical protein